MVTGGNGVRRSLANVGLEMGLRSEGFGWACIGATSYVRPNVEVTGPERHGALAARRNMDNERFAARAACRGGSG